MKRENPYGTESIPADNLAGKVLQWIGKGDKAYTYYSIHIQGGVNRDTRGHPRFWLE